MFMLLVGYSMAAAQRTQGTEMKGQTIVRTGSPRKIYGFLVALLMMYETKADGALFSCLKGLQA
jgi:hypothetical protein